MKLYCKKLDIRTKDELLGTIVSSANNDIYIRFNAKRTDENSFNLDLYETMKGEHINLHLAEDYDCRMYAKDILNYVEQRIDNIWRVIKNGFMDKVTR